MQMDEMMESRVDGMAPILGAMSLLMDEGLAEQMHRKSDGTACIKVHLLGYLCTHLKET